MFSKILVANRGEIAVRVMKTAKRLGISTVAVYSDADADSVAVRMADEAVRLGPPPSAESYLLGDLIIQAAKDTGAEAIHPGFGFLSENAGFARAVADAGLVFIGPPPEAIEAMGDKITSKKLAAEAGVSTVPGYQGEIADAEEAVRVSRDIGYPVMIKASAGGGGKGMRIAHDDDEAREGLNAAVSEAESSFGDGRVFIEKFVEQPRHIEIQVLADRDGNTLYLNERECSVQRRHQKVVEEAPSPFLDAETRAAMGEQATALARAVGYFSAGTVEFIVGPDRQFYFLEMNTRLQVEHPVTEMITGLDLVEEMLRVAAGEKLRITQDEVPINGWSMECRLYAENPERSFVPSTGRLSGYRPPEETASVRVDSGVEEGSDISMFYDPMIAKLVTHGADRAAAIETMQAALDAFYVSGISHNGAFLNAVLENERFRAGTISTAFIEEEFADGYSGEQLAAKHASVLVSAAVSAYARISRSDATLKPAGVRASSTAVPCVAMLAGENYGVTVTESDEGFRIAGDRLTGHLVTDWRPGEPVMRGRLDGKPIAVQIERDGVGFHVAYRGASVRVEVMPPRAAELLMLMPVKEPPDLSKFLMSPMPGLLVSLAVADGDPVQAGQALAVVEAMKMENILRAEQDGVVAAVKAAPGDSLAADQVIIEFE